MGAPIKQTVLTPEDTATLKMWASSGKTPQRKALRARVILTAAEGLSLHGIAERTGLGYDSCLKWRKRFQASGLDGLTDKPGRGRHETITQEQRLEILALACTTPVDGCNRRSVRKLSEATGIGVGSVNRILSAGDLRPHKVKYWCGKSPDLEFAAKQAAIIGLYMAPPENALVLCVDEKSQIQVLDHTQSLLAMMPGHPKRITATYKRHETAGLLAALSVHEGTVEGRCVESTNHRKFLNFLKLLYRKYQGKHLHVIAANLSAHKHTAVME